VVDRGLEEVPQRRQLVVVDHEAPLVQLGRRRHDLDPVVVAVEPAARVVVAEAREQVRRRELEPLADDEAHAGTVS
jgi:CO dehydrogenase nickel-insertion accessory protein CooC1